MTTASNTHAGQVPRWSIQDRLRKAREHAGMTQGQLADRIGVARNSVSNYESGATRQLRHRFATCSYQRSGDIRAVQELLGHASVATTQRYTKVADGALRRAVMIAAS